MRRRTLLPLSLLLARPQIHAAQPMAAAPARSYSFGIVPQQSATELARLWIPLLSAVAERSGIGLRFATAPDIPTFEQRLAAGRYDVAYMNPYHYTVFSQRPGYAAFAKEKGRTLRGIVVVRRDSPATGLEALGGQDIAFPAPAAFAATVLVRAELQRRRIPYTPRFVNSHESVYLNVARGLHPAGGGIGRTLQAMPAEVRGELRVLWSTAEYTPHAFAVHPRVPAADAQALLRAATSLESDPRGRSLLEGLGFRGIEPAQDTMWNDVRALGIDTLAALLRE
jgi:phosphonate transport system substrate-binding protein